MAKDQVEEQKLINSNKHSKLEYISYLKKNGYEKLEMDNSKKIKRGDMVSYVTDTGKIRIGGIVKYVNHDKGYMYLINDGTEWSVNFSKLHRMYVKLRDQEETDISFLSDDDD